METGVKSVVLHSEDDENDLRFLFISCWIKCRDAYANNKNPSTTPERQQYNVGYLDTSPCHVTYHLKKERKSLFILDSTKTKFLGGTVERLAKKFTDKVFVTDFLNALYQAMRTARHRLKKEEGSKKMDALVAELQVQNELLAGELRKLTARVVELEDAAKNNAEENKLRDGRIAVVTATTQRLDLCEKIAKERIEGIEAREKRARTETSANGVNRSMHRGR